MVEEKPAASASEDAESAVTDEERDKTLELADELTEKGSVFLKECDFAESVDCFSRALEIRVEHYGVNLRLSALTLITNMDLLSWRRLRLKLIHLVTCLRKMVKVNKSLVITTLQTVSEPVAASVVSSNPERQGCSSGGQAVLKLMHLQCRMERLANEIKCPSGSATSSTVSEIDQGIQQSSSVPYIDKSASEKEAEIETLSGLAEDLEKKLEDLKQQAENPKQLLAELMGMASAKASLTDKAVATAAGEMSSSRMGTANTGKDLEWPTVSTVHTGEGGGASSGVTHLGVVGRGVKRVLLNATSADSSPSKKLAPESSDEADGNSS